MNNKNKRDIQLFLSSLGVTPGGGCATFNARPNAPGKLLLSRTTNVPGGLFFNIPIAATTQFVRI
jgi:hypothetical protein